MTVRTRRMAVEALEDRCVPATHVWTGALTPGNLNWSPATNWSGGAPTSNELGGTFVTIGNQTNAIQDINGLVINQLAFTSNNFTLTLAQDLRFPDSTARSTLVSTGGTKTITGGTIFVLGDSGIGGGTPFGTFRADVTGGTTTIASTINTPVGLTKTGAGTLVLTGANLNSLGSSINVLGGNLTVTGGGGNKLRANSFVNVAPGAVFETAQTNSTGTVGNAINVSLNAGTYLLTGGGNNTGTHVNNLTLLGGSSVRNGGAIGSFFGFNVALQGSVNVLAGGASAAPAVFDLPNGLGITGNHTFTVADITGTDAPDLTLSATTAIVNEPGVVGSVTKAGPGTMVLGAANGYTGTTAVTGGTLLVNGSLAAASAVTVSGTDPNNSTFLGGSGVIGGPVQVQNGAVIGPGSTTSTATLGVGGLSFQTGGAFGVKIGGGAAGQFDALAVTGAVNLTNGGVFAVPTGAVPAVGSVLTVIANDGADAVVGTFAGLPEGATFQDAGGNPYTISYVGGDGNDVTLTATTDSPPPPPPPPPGAPLLSALLVTGPGNGTGTVFTPINGQYQAGASATLIPGFSGETHVALGDVNGDRVPDIVAATGPGGSRVRVLDGATGTAAEPTVLADFEAFPGYAGGVFVAVGDLNGDGRADIAVTPDAADAFSGPVSNQLPVRVYSGAGFGLLASFDGLASLSGASGQGNAAVKLGGRPAIADVNGDGLPDLLVAAGSGGGPRITVWGGTGFAGANGGRPTTNPIANLFVFESGQRGGAFVTAGDVNGDGFAEVIVGGGPGGGPRVRVVNGRLLFDAGAVPNLEGVNLDDPTNLSNGLVLNNFFAGSDTLRGGVRVAVRDADGDRLADVVVGSGTNERSGLRVYRAPSLAAAAGTSGEPGGAQTIDPFGSDLAGGVWVG